MEICSDVRRSMNRVRGLHFAAWLIYRLHRHSKLKYAAYYMLQNHLFWDYPFLPRNQVLSGNTWYCISLLWHFEPHLWHILDHIHMMISCNRIPCCLDEHMSTLVLCWKRFWTFSGDQKLSRIYSINNVIHIDVGDSDFRWQSNVFCHQNQWDKVL